MSIALREFVTLKSYSHLLSWVFLIVKEKVWMPNIKELQVVKVESPTDFRTIELVSMYDIPCKPPGIETSKGPRHGGSSFLTFF